MTRTEKALLTAAFLLFCGSVYLQFVAGSVGDKNWLLLAARMWLSGKKIYGDIFEVNPPLIIWLYALPVFISLHLSFVEDFHILVLLGLLVVAFSIFISLQLVKLHSRFSDDYKKQIQFIVLLGFVFVFFTSPMYFFDREHIFLVLIFPYVLRFMPSVSRAPIPVWLRIIIGCMAGVGFCIKPHCLIVFAGLQLLYFLREHSLRILLSIENLLVTLLALLYLFFIWWFTPDYFLVVLPMALATYSAYKVPGNGIFYFLIAALIFGITFVDFRLRYTSAYRKDIFYMLGVSLCLLTYALLNNGWAYTYNPLISMLLITTGFVLWEYLYLKQEYASRGLPFKQFLFGARACMIIFSANTALVIAIFFMTLTEHCDDDPTCRANEALVQKVKESHARSFGALIMNFYLLPEIFRGSGAQPQIRFHNLWMLPKFIILDHEFTSRHQWIPAYVAQGLADDLNRNKPEIVIVDASPEFYTTKKHVDLLAFFFAYPAFKEAWQPHYHYRDVIDNCHPPHASECRYALYMRNMRTP